MTRMQELYEKVAKDNGLQAQFSLIMAEAEQAGQIDDPSGKAATEEKLLAFARGAGFEVSIEEMQAFFQGMAAQAEGELSDAELDQVAGGKSGGGIVHVIGSVLSVGIGCAIMSAVVEVAKSGGCNRYFQ